MILNKKNTGFTVAEVSIATAIFSVVILIALVSFFTISRLFYKGVTVSQTQETAQQIIQDVKGSFQTTKEASSHNSFGYTFYCVGSARYTYNPGHEVTADTSSTAYFKSPGNGGQFGLVKDTLPGDSSCQAPCAAGDVCGNAVPFNSPVELIGKNMRLSQLDVTLIPPDPAHPNTEVYNISVSVAYGEDDVFTDSTHSECKPDAQTQQFCYISTVNTSVYKGLGF